MSRPLDGCPNCVRGYHEPLRTEPGSKGGLVAHYRCRYCGHTWWTSWGYPHEGDGPVPWSEVVERVLADLVSGQPPRTEPAELASEPEPRPDRVQQPP